MPYAYFYGRVSHAISANRKYGESDVCNSVEHQFAMVERRRQSDALLGRPVPPWAPTGWVGRKREVKPTSDGRYIDQEVSAFKEAFRDRPAGHYLHAALQPGDTLYVAYMHRAFRSWKDFAWMLDHWRRHKIRVVFCHPDIDLDTIAGETFAAVLSIMDGFMSQMLSERLRSEAALRREAGLAVSRWAPLGWKHERRNNRKYCVPDDELREVLLQVIELHENECLNFQEIADIIEQRRAEKEGRDPCPDYPYVGWEGRKYSKNLIFKMYERRQFIPLPGRLLPPGTRDVPLSTAHKRELKRKDVELNRQKREAARLEKIAQRDAKLLRKLRRRSA